MAGMGGRTNFKKKADLRKENNEKSVGSSSIDNIYLRRYILSMVLATSILLQRTDRLSFILDQQMIC